MTIVIKAQLTLAARLVDTTTGKEVSENDAKFYINGNLFQPMKKGAATYVFVNMGREDFLMRVCVFGYEEEIVNVSYDALDQKLPMIDIFLMPLEKNRIGGPVIQINGTLSGLEFIEAINLERPQAVFQSAVTKKDVTRMMVLPIASGGGVSLDAMAYAMLTKDQTRYEVFTVKEQDTPTSVVLRAQLRFEHELNDRIFRIIYGRAGPRGDFILKVRDDSSTSNYLLHFAVNGQEYLRPIDFHLETGVINPLQGASIIQVLEEKEEEKNE